MGLFNMEGKVNPDIIEFVRKTTEAITIISESTKQQVQVTGAIKEMISTQNAANVTAFEKLNGKQDAALDKMEDLKKVFLYVLRNVFLQVFCQHLLILIQPFLNLRCKGQ